MRPHYKTNRNRKALKEEILFYLDGQEDFVFIGDLHAHMTKLGFHNKDIARAFAALRSNFTIVYHIEHNKQDRTKVINIASVPEDIRDEILNFYTESYRRAEVSARKSALSVLLNHYSEKWREGITI